MAKAKSLPTTLGQLRDSGYQVLPVRQEIRRNLITKMQRKEELFPGIVGYDDSVIPQLENAILAGQDMILLGERGQAKSRIIRGLVQLLDERIPIVAGSEVNDDPFDPISKFAKELVGAKGDATPIAWVKREDRYGEKREGRHWVRYRSEKGVLLRKGAAQMAVVHDEMRVNLNRLVVASDFVLDRERE